MKRFMSMIFFFRRLRAKVGWNFLISFEKEEGVHILLSITGIILLFRSLPNEIYACLNWMAENSFLKICLENS